MTLLPLESVIGAIRANCAACGGVGGHPRAVIREAHGCDGTDADCARTCPVPDEDVEMDECEACGTQIAAVRSIAPSDADASIAACREALVTTRGNIESLRAAQTPGMATYTPWLAVVVAALGLSERAVEDDIAIVDGPGGEG